MKTIKILLFCSVFFLSCTHKKKDTTHLYNVNTIDSLIEKASDENTSTKQRIFIANKVDSIIKKGKSNSVKNDDYIDLANVFFQIGNKDKYKDISKQLYNISKKRIYSFVVDTFILNLIGFFIFSLLDVKELNVTNFEIFGQNFKYGYSLQIVFFILYFIVCDLLNKGKTLGKLLFSIQVVHKDNFKELSTSKLVVRTFYKIVSILILPVSVVAFLMYHGVTIQDKISNTTTIIVK